ncbi:MAG: flagellar motor switch protein FliM [Deltaproteobacteria bacterium]|nr:flagellar motor switch protein FliM [Deltaproteobacteria bacterium]MBW2338805.1 flagellar motor switch protein FliM [Deltaproteobacteria bacterium]
MGNVLSQDEVDSLLNGISDGKVKTETDTPEKGEGLEVYDFTSQVDASLASMPALGIINERFVGSARASLSAATRSTIDVNISSTESVKFNEFSRSISFPASLNIFKMEPLKGFALLVMEGPLVFAFIDTFFGGKSFGHVKLEGRDFTAIEIRIIEKVIGIILGDLEHAWSDVHKVKMVFVRSEMDPQFAAIAKPDDSVMVNRFAVEIGNSSGNMTICIPYSTIEPLRENLKQGFHNESLEVDQRWRKQIEGKIKGLAINVQCTLGMTKITGRQLLGIKVDDVIPLEKGVNDLITVSIEDIPKFKGFPGTRNNRQAIRISERIDKE